MTITIEKQANGLTFATDMMHDIETVSIAVLVKVGSRYEDLACAGISHFLGHMAFKGTTTRTALQIAEQFDDIGGYFNAYTSREKTVYYAKVLKEDLDRAADILGDILQNSVYNEADIKQEGNVILQEIAQNNDAPDDLVFDMLYQQAFPDQSFGYPILGDQNVVATMTADALRGFVAEHYSYQNIVITAAGNCSHERLSDIATDKFTTFSSKAPSIAATPTFVPGDARTNKDLEQIHMAIAFQGVAYQSNDFYLQQILSIILGGGMSSRLFQEVREKRGLAYSISSFGSAYKDIGIFGIYTSTGEGEVNTMVDVIGQELKKICQGISHSEIERAKAQVRASLLMSQESSSSRAERLASNIAAVSRYISNQEILDNINAIDEAKLLSFANKLLKQNPAIASIGKIANLYEYGAIAAKLSS